ncbi:MAG: bL21 family ribosomal protein, partial [Firmicutes bacterium]|nr:bL21 family ribosomal protein [Bacillota bacterium]
MPHKEVEVSVFRSPYLASNDNRRCHMYAIIATGGKQYKVAEGDV